eukprot:GHVO01012769.1.p1 GENE.GHVO01012769.1~~GHVO01012769.1.p1  ORF type:complete len:269 (+),score=36.51 GHVO01012769.1:44-808(+)
MNKAVCVSVDTWKSGYSKLLEAIDGSTYKAIVICNPCNPTGRCLPLHVLQRIAQAVRGDPNVIVIADEIYADLEMNKGCMIPFASLPDMRLRTITVSGFSKNLAMTGFRVGYMACPNRQLIERVASLQSHVNTCAAAPSQYAALCALKCPNTPSWLAHRIEELKSNRDMLIEKLSETTSLDIGYVPDGAFYVLVNLPHGWDGQRFCRDLLHDTGVACVGGEGFQCPGTFRISYAVCKDELEKAAQRISEYLAKK